MESNDAHTRVTTQLTNNESRANQDAHTPPGSPAHQVFEVLGRRGPIPRTFERTSARDDVFSDLAGDLHSILVDELLGSW